MYLNYLAYGSNLHPQRLLERVPTSKFLGKVEIRNYRLAFHKIGSDGSGKCNIIPSQEQSDIVHGALFQISYYEKPILDTYEGAGYYVDTISVNHQGEEIESFVYLAEDEPMGLRRLFRDLSQTRSCF